jgi:hypothetical protein
MIAAIVAFSVGLSPVDPARFISGEINSDFVARFRAIGSPQNPVTVASPGGIGSSGLDVADEIKQAHVPIDIAAVCVSACAEAVMAAASRFSRLQTVTLPILGAPVIGFHHNPAITKRIFERVGRRDFNACYGSDYQRFMALRGNTRSNRELWRKQEANLQIDYRAVTGERCFDVRLSFANKEWFPTSDQLRRLFGYSFSGAVCADSLECMTRAIPRAYKAGDTFVIGDTRFRYDRIAGQARLTAIDF